MTRDMGLRDTGQSFDKLRSQSRVSCLEVSRLIVKPLFLILHKKFQAVKIQFFLLIGVDFGEEIIL